MTELGNAGMIGSVILCQPANDWHFPDLTRRHSDIPNTAPYS
jgi:hypothetical protein